MSSNPRNIHPKNQAHSPVTQIGVVGAGTMGSGIALAALLADLRVILFDLSAEMLGRAQAYIEQHLQRKRMAINLKYLRLESELAGLQGCQVVIEAVPEDLAMKKELFAQLDRLCPPPAILATNTSTLPVTAIAAATSTPERVAGMHFFNPAPVMPLVELVHGARTTPETIQRLTRLAEKLGKTPVVARDTPGFIVNRVARPFYGEALRLLGEGAATVEQIDCLVRDGGGFRMGPFELLDLIGIDVNFAATRSIYEQTFHEPRYRPHLIQAQMIDQGALGRKTGRGFYDYASPLEPGKVRGLAVSVKGPASSPATGSPGKAVIYSPGSWAPGMDRLCERAGFRVLGLPPDGEFPHQPAAAMGLVATGRSEGMPDRLRALERALSPEAPILCQCADVMLAEVALWLEHPERLVGFDGLFAASGSLVTCVASPALIEPVRRAVEVFLVRLGCSPVWIKDTPALVLPRLVCALANEAAFAVGEGVAGPETIDRAMQLGTNYPKGPLAWAGELGWPRVIAVLDHLRAEYGEERYRPAPAMRALGRLAQLHKRNND